MVNARDAGEFVPFGRAILDAADQHRKPIFVVIDEGQLFSASRRGATAIGEAADIINEFAERGRKRALDLFITALRYTGTLQRTLFANKNLTLIGWQEDPTAWSALAPQFKASKIEFADLNALTPGEFFCLSRRGVEKIRMPMAAALKAVAPKAKPVAKTLPATFNQWTRAMSADSDRASVGAQRGCGGPPQHRCGTVAAAGPRPARPPSRTSWRHGHDPKHPRTTRPRLGALRGRSWASEPAARDVAFILGARSRKSAAPGHRRLLERRGTEELRRAVPALARPRTSEEGMATAHEDRQQPANTSGRRPELALLASLVGRLGKRGDRADPHRAPAHLTGDPSAMPQPEAPCRTR